MRGTRSATVRSSRYVAAVCWPLASSSVGSSITVCLLRRAMNPVASCDCWNNESVAAVMASADAAVTVAAVADAAGPASDKHGSLTYLDHQIVPPATSRQAAAAT